MLGMRRNGSERTGRTDALVPKLQSRPRQGRECGMQHSGGGSGTGPCGGAASTCPTQADKQVRSCEARSLRLQPWVVHIKSAHGGARKTIYSAAPIHLILVLPFTNIGRLALMGRWCSLVLHIALTRRGSQVRILAGPFSSILILSLLAMLAADPVLGSGYGLDVHSKLPAAEACGPSPSPSPSLNQHRRCHSID